MGGEKGQRYVLHGHLVQNQPGLIVLVFLIAAPYLLRC